MFRGGKVDSYGTGIASGLGTRSGYFRGGGVSYNPFNQTQTQSLVEAYKPRGLPQSFIDFFKANQAKQRPSGRFRTMGPGATLAEAEGLFADASGSSGDTVMERAYAEVLANAPTPFGIDDDVRQEGPKLGVGSDYDKDVSERYLVGDPERNTGLEALRKGNIRDVGKTTIEDLTTEREVKKVDIKDDEPEVTMTDLEKALGLDKARQEYAADALAAASKALFEGRGFEAIADAAAVKSKAPDIKRLAALEEFKMKGAKDIARLKDKKRQFAPGNVQKTVDYLVSQGVDKDEAIRRATKQSGTFAEELSKNSVGGTILSSGFALAAETFYGSDYKGDVTAVDVIQADKSTQLPDGFYSDKDNKLIFEVKDKKVVFDRSYS